LGLNWDIDDYIKSDPNLILTTILKANGEDQDKLAKYLCSRFHSIQSNDESLDSANSWLSGLATAAGVLCFVPGANLIACPATAILSVGALASGIETTTRSVLDEYANERALVRGGVNPNEFILTEQISENRSENGVKQAGASLFGAGTGVLKTAQLAKLNGSNSSSWYNNVTPRYPLPGDTKLIGTSALLGSTADDVLIQGQKLITGPSSLPGPVGATSSNTAIIMGDATKTATTNLPRNFGQMINSSTQAGNKAIPTVANSSAQVVKPGFEVSTNVLPRAVVAKPPTKPIQIVNSLGKTNPKIQSNTVGQVGRKPTTTNIDVDKLNLSRTQWDLLKKNPSNPGAQGIPSIKNIKFLDDAGDITSRGRRIFANIKKIETLPSKEVSDSYIKATLNLSKIMKTNPIENARIKAEAIKKLRSILGTRGDAPLTQAQAKKEFSALTAKIAGKWPKDSQVARVARDEQQRAQKIFDFIFKSLPK
jgi:hypothetical protein